MFASLRLQLGLCNFKFVDFLVVKMVLQTCYNNVSDATCNFVTVLFVCSWFCKVSINFEYGIDSAALPHQFETKKNHSMLTAEMARLRSRRIISKLKVYV